MDPARWGSHPGRDRVLLLTSKNREHRYSNVNGVIAFISLVEITTILQTFIAFTAGRLNYGEVAKPSQEV